MTDTLTELEVEQLWAESQASPRAHMQLIIALVTGLATVRCLRCQRSGVEHADADHVLVDPELAS